MNQAQATQIIDEAEQLMETVMGLYGNYLRGLAKIVEALPDSEMELMAEIYDHMEEVQASLEHDVNLFDKAIHSDLEDLGGLKDQLKINAIYKKLKK